MTIHHLHHGLGAHRISPASSKFRASTVSVSSSFNLHSIQSCRRASLYVYMYSRRGIAQAGACFFFRHRFVSHGPARLPFLDSADPAEWAWTSFIKLQKSLVHAGLTAHCGRRCKKSPPGLRAAEVASWTLQQPYSGGRNISWPDLRAPQQNGPSRPSRLRE